MQTKQPNNSVPHRHEETLNQFWEATDLFFSTMSVITTALLLQTNCSSYSFETLFLNGPALSVRLCELALEWSFVTATQACFKLALLIRNCLTPATLFYLSHNYLTHPLHNSLFCSPVQGASFSFSLNLCTHLSPLFLGPLSIPPPNHPLVLSPSTLLLFLSSSHSPYKNTSDITISLQIHRHIYALDSLWQETVTKFLINGVKYGLNTLSHKLLYKQSSEDVFCCFIKEIFMQNLSRGMYCNAWVLWYISSYFTAN